MLEHRLPRDLAVTALEKALAARGSGPGLLHHTDRSSQYASSDYQELLGPTGFCHGLLAADGS